MKPEGFIHMLTEKPILRESDIDDAMKHNASWKRELVSIVRSRSCQRLSDIANESISAAGRISDAATETENRINPLE